MRIVITGAAGHLGNLATEELSDDHELVLLDRRPVRSRPSIVADLGHSPDRRWPPWDPPWKRAFEGAEVVLHLAAVLAPASWRPSSWPVVKHNNIDATWNVFEAALRHRVPKIVYGSSTWAIRGAEHELDSGGNGEARLASDQPPRPLLTYGLSKAFGEMAGRMLVDEKRLDTFIAVRIGYCPPDRRPPATAYLRDLWIGHRDITSLLRRCVEADRRGFHVVYGVSRPDSRYDLTHTTQLLDWRPVEPVPPVSEPA